MELEYPYILVIGIVLGVAMIVLSFVRFGKGPFKGGKKIATPGYLADDPYFKKKKIWYQILTKAGAIACAAAVILCSAILARPVSYKVDVQEKYSRDIMLCLDVSTSVDELNERLVGELQDLVKDLKGERIGIIIFNTSPVLLVPLTDDYEFVLEQLQTIEKALKVRERYMYYNIYDNDTMYYLSYLEAGTIVGNEERGSSLIGDGLASCVNNFSDAEGRPRIIIFTTDNCLEGEPLISLKDAAALCAVRDATVYGIGTRQMYDTDMQDMKDAVESTGGAFFLEESGSAFSDIVEQINTDSEGLIDSKKVYHKVDGGQGLVVGLLLAAVAMLGLARIVRR